MVLGISHNCPLCCFFLTCHPIYNFSKPKFVCICSCELACYGATREWDQVWIFALVLGTFLHEGLDLRDIGLRYHITSRILFTSSMLLESEDCFLL